MVHHFGHAVHRNRFRDLEQSVLPLQMPSCTDEPLDVYLRIRMVSLTISVCEYCRAEFSREYSLA